MEDIDVLHSFLFEQGVEKDDLPAFKKKMADPVLQEGLHELMRDVYKDERDLATFRGMFVPEKKKSEAVASSVASGGVSKTGSVVTPQTEDGGLSEEDIAKNRAFLEEQKAKQLGSPAAKDLGTANTQLQTTEDPAKSGIDEQGHTESFTKRQEVLGQTAKSIAALNTAKGVDPAEAKAWEDDIAATLSDKSRPQEVNDVIALRKAYDRFREFGIEREMPLVGESMGGVFKALDYTPTIGTAVQHLTSNEESRGMNSVAKALEEAEAKVRMENPQQWQKLQQQGLEKTYGSITGGKKLIDDALTDGLSGIEEAKPTERDNSVDELKQQLSGAFQKELAAGADINMLLDDKIKQLDAAGDTENAAIARQQKEMVQRGGTADNTGADPILEARLRNEIAFRDGEINRLNAAGRTEEAKALAPETAQIREKADELKAARQKSIVDGIADMDAYLKSQDLSKFERKAAQARRSELVKQMDGFLNPGLQFHQAMADNITEIRKASKPEDTPREAMMKYYAQLVYEKRVLDDRLYGKGSEGITRELSGATFRGWSEDEKRSQQLGWKLKSLGPVVLLNEMPEKDRSLGASAFDSFLNTVYGSASIAKLADTNTAQGKALDVSDMLQTIGVNEATAINGPSKAKFDEMKAGSDIVSWEHAGELGGMLTGLGLLTYAPGKITQAAGAGKLLARLSADVAKGIPGARFARVAASALTKGAQYEMTGEAFKDQEHFFGFAQGLLGGFAEGAVMGAARLGMAGKAKAADALANTGEMMSFYGGKKAQIFGRMLSNAFGSKADEASRIIVNVGGKEMTLAAQLAAEPGKLVQKLSHGVGGVVGQGSEGLIRAAEAHGDGSAIDGLVKLFSEGEPGRAAWEEYKAQFGNTSDERFKFFFDMFALGVLTGGHDKGLGHEIRERALAIHKELSGKSLELANDLLEESSRTTTLAAESLKNLAEEVESPWWSDGKEKSKTDMESPYNPIDEAEAETVVENAGEPTEEPVVETTTAAGKEPETTVEAVSEPLNPAHYTLGNDLKNRTIVLRNTKTGEFHQLTKEENDILDSHMSKAEAERIENNLYASKEDKVKYTNQKEGLKRKVLERIASEKKTTIADAETVAEPLEEPVVSPAPDQNAGTAKDIEEKALSDEGDGIVADYEAEKGKLKSVAIEARSKAFGPSDSVRTIEPKLKQIRDFLKNELGWTIDNMSYGKDKRLTIEMGGESFTLDAKFLRMGGEGGEIIPDFNPEDIIKARAEAKLKGHGDRVDLFNAKYNSEAGRTPEAPPISGKEKPSEVGVVEPKVEAEKKASDVPAADGKTRISIKTESGKDLDIDIDLSDLMDEEVPGDITVKDSKPGEQKPQDALDAHMKEVMSTMGEDGAKQVKQAAAEIIAGKPREIATKGLDADTVKAVDSAVELAKQAGKDAFKNLKTKSNRVGKTKPLRTQKPAETMKEVFPAIVEAENKPTPENKAHVEAVNEQIGRNAERAMEPPRKEGKPKPKPRKKAGKAGELPEGVEEQFKESHIGGYETEWRKRDGKWEWRTNRSGGFRGKNAHMGNWSEAKGKDIEKAERMSNMEATTLDVMNAAKELASATVDLATFNMLDPLGSKRDADGKPISMGTFDPLGLLGNSAKLTARVVKLGIKIAKALVDSGEYNYHNWRAVMDKVAGDAIPEKEVAKAWEEVQKEHPTDEKKAEAPKVKEGPKAKEKPADAGNTKAKPTVETPEQKRIRELEEENARLKAGDKKKKTKKKVAPTTTTQATTEPTTKTTTSAATGETATSGIWTTLSKYKGTKANSPHLDKVLERMNNTYGKVSHDLQFGRAMEALGWVKGEGGKPGHFDGNPLRHLADLTSGADYKAEDFSILLEKRLVMMDILGKSLQGLEATKKAEIEKGASPEAIKEIEDSIIAGMQATENLANVLKQQGTIGGQGNSFIGFWRNMYTHADALIAAKIMQTNRDLQYNQKLQDKVALEMEAMREIREREAENVANDTDFDAKVDEVTSKSAGKSAKPNTPAGEPKKTIAEKKAELAAQIKKANKNLMSSLSSGGLAGLEVLPLLVKYGKLLIEEKFVNFKAWAAKMREDNGKISDTNLQKIWEGKDEETGLTLKEHAQLELKKAASAPEGEAKRQQSLREKIQKELNSKDPEDLITRLEEKVGLTNEEALFVAKEHESPANLEKLVKRAEERKAAKAKADADSLGWKRQAYIDKKAADIEKSRRLELEGKVKDALKEFTSKQGPKGMEDLLKEQGLDDAQVAEVMAARGAEFEKAGMEALDKAAKTPEQKKAVADPSLRAKVQKALNDHFKVGNDGTMSLKDRLMKEAGLTDAQAETILKAEDAQIKTREAALNKKIGDMIADQAARDAKKWADERKVEVKRGVRQAISDHFHRDNIEKRLQSELGMSPENAKQVAAIARRPLWNGKARTNKEMAETIANDTGLPADKVKDALDIVAREKAKTFQDRIMEHTGVDQAQADVLASAFKEAFDKRAKAQIEARAKKLRTKSKGRRTSVRPKNDVDRALETITDRDLTDEDMNRIFKERLGFMQALDPEQSAYVRNLGDQLSNAKQGGILEHDAARHLDRFFDQFLPKDSLGKRVADIWQGLWIAGMLSGTATTIKNIMSAATIVAFSPIQNIANWSEWNRAIREAGGLKGLGTAEGRKKAIRLSPLMGAVVKYKALTSGQVWATARRTAADIFLEGYMGTKFSEVGETALGRQMTVLERRAYKSFAREMDKAVNIIDSKSTPAQIANFAARQVQHTVQAYAWAAKWSGRNLQMQDVFIRTIATEMQLTDAFRRSSVETTKAQMAAVGFDPNKGYAAWVNYNLSQSKHPNFKAAVNKAVTEVLEHQVALGKITQAQSDVIKTSFDGDTRDNGLPTKANRKEVKATSGIPKAELAQARRFVRVRTRELLLDGFMHEGKTYGGLAISEKARESAASIAKSQIFTEKRAGVATMISDGVNKLKSVNAFTNFALSPLVPFTTIISNMVATMADYNPVMGIPRAHGMSLIDAAAKVAGKNKKGEYSLGSSAMGIDPSADWIGWRLKNAMRFDQQIDPATGHPVPGTGKIDQRFYEQMGRALTGVHTLVGLAMMTNGNPMGPGIGVTYAPDMDPFNDTGDEYSVFFNGTKLFSYKEYPFLAAPFAFLGAWHSFGRNPEEFGGATGFANRLMYSMWSSETMALKMSVGEGAANAINMLADGYNSFTQRGSSDSEQWYNTFLKPYLKSMTKALPWRWSAVEQTVGLFDPSKYSTKMMNESMAYFFEGPFYGRVAKGYKDVDIFGDERVGNPIVATIPFLEGYRDEVAKRPYRKFLSERDISLDPPQNSDTVRFSPEEDSILGTDYRDYTDDEWAYFKEEAGKNFKKSLEGFMSKPGRIPDGKNPDGSYRFKDVSAEEKIAYLDSHVSIKDARKEKPMSQTEAKVRNLLTGARLSARKAVIEKFDKHDTDLPKNAAELLYGGGNQYGDMDE